MTIERVYYRILLAMQSSHSRYHNNYCAALQLLSDIATGVK